MDKNVAAMFLAAVTLFASPAWAQGNPADMTDMQALRSAVRADKKVFVASTLQLTDAEAKKFWPIYDAYQRDLDMVNRQQIRAIEGLIARDRPLSDPYARQLANDLISGDETEVKARRKLYNGVMRALPPKKAARYMQIEAKVRAFQDYDIATTFPLVK